MDPDRPRLLTPIPPHFDRVSRRHAEIWTDRYGTWIHDLGSRAGTCVNGVWIDHVSQAAIIMGDTIWMGGVELEVVEHVTELAKFRGRAVEGEKTEDPSAPDPIGRESCRRLSPAEIDVTLWLSRGFLSDVEVGRMLHRSPSTIHSEVTSILSKLALHSRAEFMGWLKRASGINSLANFGGGGGAERQV